MWCGMPTRAPMVLKVIVGEYIHYLCKFRRSLRDPVSKMTGIDKNNYNNTLFNYVSRDLRRVRGQERYTIEHGCQ